MSAEIDEGFYSRQLYVLGHDAMRRMGTARVLVAGMGGLGVEIAKNVILSGVESVTVQDEGDTVWTDLSSQFFLKESHLGRNRAECCIQQLRDLNPRVCVSAHTGPLDHDLLRRFQVVVLTRSSLDDQKRFGDFCHAQGIRFVVADTKGLCGQLFCDFGEEFEVLDWDGETPETVIVQNISKDNPGVVLCAGDHRFPDDAVVSFSEVQGMTELNGLGPVKIKNLSDSSFSIGDTSAFSEYKCGGMATEIKQPLKFKPLSDALLDHQTLIINGYGTVTRHRTLHLAFQALHGFVASQRRLPLPHSDADADALVAMVRELNEVARLEQLDEFAVRSLAYTARGDLAPVNAFIGGLAAQEVIKACSRKFIPLQQWLYCDAFECLPENGNQQAERSSSTDGTRYDGQTAVFGSAFQEKLAKQKYFLVGAGAIGCELLKNFALMGLGASEDGHITVTDMDRIEKSNLNRQFLFRSQDIGEPKSKTAAKAVGEINPQMNITAHQNRLDPDSEDVYDYHFFTGLDGVAAALDNIDARVYLNDRCVQHRKPMLEGGTEGSMGHTLVVVPHMTKSYGKATKSPTEDIPLCTIKYFPSRIEHTLQWARNQFEGHFKQNPENMNLFLNDVEFVDRTLSHGDAEALEVLEGVWNCLEVMTAGGKRPTSWEDCVTWARSEWETLFNHKICQLLHNVFPDKATDPDLSSWSGTEKKPHPLTFNPNNTTHMDYVVAAANLYAQIYGLEGTRDRTSITQILDHLVVPPFVSTSSIKIDLTKKEEEEEEKECDDYEKARLKELKELLSLPSVRASALQMHPTDFEKDDDQNFHMDYITAASNLRAENYGITPVDRHESKRIAGKIIPAIATTTAAVAGLMCLELYKLVQGHRDISSYCTSFFNLSSQYFVWSRPTRAKRFTDYPSRWELW
uniref:Ubiquitin-activating enzyme E1 n=1 Tax=Tetraodon nigroviridis TaxID=99883 RepID=H3DB89_TETNG